MRNIRYRVLFLASWYPNRLDKIVGIFAKRKAEAISSLCSVSVLYVTLDSTLKDKTYDIEEIEENGIYTVRVYFKPSYLPLLTPLVYLFRYMRGNTLGLRLILKNWGIPDLCHVNVIYPAGFFAIFLKYIKKIKYIITEYSTPDIDYVKGITTKTHLPAKFFKKIIVKKSEYTNVNSQASLDFLKKLQFKGNLGIAGNVIEIDEKYMFKQKPATDRKIAIHISILNERKNVADIIRVFANIHAKGRKNIELQLVGIGEQKCMLEALAQELGVLNKCVTFLGFVSDEEKLKRLSAADVHILNSDEEGFSVVTAEAITYGIPVIATKCGGPEDFVTDETGILIERRNMAELEKAIEHIFDNPSEFKREKMQAYGKSKFSEEVIANHFYDVYSSVLNYWRVGHTQALVNIETSWKVIDIGSGHNPNNRADVLLEKHLDETMHRTSSRVIVPKGKRLIVADALNTPFKTNEFDFAIANHIAEHIDDPVGFCVELQRISRCGYIETPGPLTEFLMPDPAHQWVIRNNGNTLIFKKNKYKTPFLGFFYSLFYLNRENMPHKTYLSHNSLLIILQYLLAGTWKYVPLAYTKIHWKDNFNVQVLD